MKTKMEANTARNILHLFLDDNPNFQVPDAIELMDKAFDLLVDAEMEGE